MEIPLVNKYRGKFCTVSILWDFFLFRFISNWNDFLYIFFFFGEWLSVIFLLGESLKVIWNGRILRVEFKAVKNPFYLRCPETNRFPLQEILHEIFHIVNISKKCQLRTTATNCCWSKLAFRLSKTGGKYKTNNRNLNVNHERNSKDIWMPYIHTYIHTYACTIVHIEIV